MRNVLRTLILLIFALPAAQRSVLAGVEGDVELLRLVAEGNKANREKIGTWRMQVTERATDKVYSTGVLKESTAQFDFVYDGERGAKRWKYLLLTFRSTGKDGVIFESEPDSLYQGGGNVLVLDGALYRYRLFFPTSNTSRRPVKIYDDAGRPHSYMDPGRPYSYMSEDMDGFNYFEVGTGSNVYKHLMRYVRDHNNPNLNVTVSRSGNIITIESGLGRPERGTIAKYDASRGYNLVECSSYGISGSKEVRWHHEWEWENVDGVFVPAKVKWRREKRNADTGRLQGFREKTLTFTNHEINIPIDPSEFTLAAIGVQPGDNIIDHRKTDRRKRSRRVVSYRYRVDANGRDNVLGLDFAGLAGEFIDEIEMDEESAEVVENADDPDEEEPPEHPPDRTYMFSAALALLAVGFLAAARAMGWKKRK